MQKYFLAILPPNPFLDQVERLKLDLKDQFGVKYALKSPAHITVKMPFSYDENRESVLLQRLQEVFVKSTAVEVSVAGTGRFGNRVIFLSVKESQALRSMQSNIRSYCRKELHLTEELSDRNFTPHLTVAFKDLKPAAVDEIYVQVKNRRLEFSWTVSEICLLKKIEERWKPVHFFPFGQKND